MNIIITIIICFTIILVTYEILGVWKKQIDLEEEKYKYPQN